MALSSSDLDLRIVDDEVVDVVVVNDVSHQFALEGKKSH